MSLLLAAACLIVSGGQAVAARGGGSSTTYVDCSASRAGNGSFGAPLNTLAAVSARTLGPDDQVLLRRGTTCQGVLAPHGTGAAGRPVVIGAYGTGQLPHVAGGGAAAAVLLQDVSHVVVQDLDVTNSGNATDVHRGVYLTATDELVTDVTVRRLEVHDVTGPTTFSDSAKAGGGIVLQVLGPLPARFDGVTIEDNAISEVSRSGIFLFGIKGASGAPRPRAGEDWPAASSHIVVQRNLLERLAGDGIVTDATEGAVIASNVLTAGNLSGRNYLDVVNRNCSAGIWAFNANSTVIEHNEVFGMKFGQSSTDGCDGTAFDIDYNNDGTIVQYNYSHDNEGGFILLCSDTRPRTADIRYNLSIDDAHAFTAAPCEAPAIGGFGGLRMYNNTFVAQNPNTGAESMPLPALYNADSFLFKNNIVYSTRPGAGPFACGQDCSHNLFFQTPPAGTDFVIGDPSFIDASRRGTGASEVAPGFRLQNGSAALWSGTPIPGGAAADFFGSPLLPGTTPSIGFAQH